MLYGKRGVEIGKSLAHFHSLQSIRQIQPLKKNGFTWSVWSNALINDKDVCEPMRFSAGDLS